MQSEQNHTIFYSLVNEENTALCVHDVHTTSPQHRCIDVEMTLYKYDVASTFRQRCINIMCLLGGGLNTGW